MGKRALVIGGSITGLLTARCLAEHFEQVSIVERDYLYDRPIGRKGAPQARHAHILLAAGAEIIAELFPDIAADMRSVGAIPVDASSDIRWFHYGVWKAREGIGVTLYLTNRMVFESAIRSRVRSWANVEILDDRDVTGLLVDRADNRVTGIRCLAKGAQEPEELRADLIVDCSGRGSRSPRWLADAGFPRVPESEIKMSVGYASRVYRLPRDFDVSRLPLAVYPKPPETRRMGIMFTTDDKTLLVQLGGWCRDYPPTDPDGFVSFAETLPVPEFRKLLKGAKPAPAIHPHHVPSGLRRHYDQIRGFPDGYLVLGDALCSFNPIYGQGMSAAALEVQVLRRWLRKKRKSGRGAFQSGSGRELQRKVTKAIFVPWLLALVEDLRFPDVVGRRPFGLSIIQWYVGHVLQLSATNPKILRRFMLVMNLVARPSILLAPQVFFAVLWHSLRGRPSAKIGAAEPEAEEEAEEETQEETQEEAEEGAGEPREPIAPRA